MKAASQPFKLHTFEELLAEGRIWVPGPAVQELPHTSLPIPPLKSGSLSVPAGLSTHSSGSCSSGSCSSGIRSSGIRSSGSCSPDIHSSGIDSSGIQPNRIHRANGSLPNAIRGGGELAGHEGSIPFELPSLDGILPAGGLACHAIHEFLAPSPPLVVASVLLRSFLARTPESFLVWMGKRCFPTPHLLDLLFAGFPSSSPSSGRAASGETASRKGKPFSWKDRTFFLHSNEKKKRLWMLAQLLQSPAPLAVVADGARFSLLDTRRLQLACEKERRKNIPVFFLLLRPPRDSAAPSTAQTRWLVTPELSPGEELRFSLTLFGAKGRHRPLTPSLRKWIVEVPYEKDSFRFREIPEAPGEEQRSAESGEPSGTDRVAAAAGEGALPLLPRRRVR